MLVKRRLGFVALMMCLGWSLSGGTALAHATYEGSDPADGSSVSAAPSSVWAEFSEPPGSSSYLQIYDACGDRVDDGNVSHQGYRMSVGMNSNRAGTFTVRWYVLSTIDGHPTQGSFTFTAQSGSDCPGSGSGDEPKEPKGGGNSGNDSGNDGGDPGSSGEPSGSGSSTGNDEGSRDGNASGPGGKGGTKSGGSKKERKSKDAEGKSGKPTGGKDSGDDEGPVVAGSPAGGDADATSMPALLVGLSLAALIGAIGGRIYVLVSPRGR